ncbi:hypothetical protein M5D96_003373 [Drosophila gunungcola]|uniref:Uncharacterized protein n=1 Tax=Drosophila gunungcola TaxID=103775 RepID=A0A9P9YSG8_9MUSC|nr:hypothetical protein M5D96_003373 [Drosophila gunungcola]
MPQTPVAVAVLPAQKATSAAETKASKSGGRVLLVAAANAKSFPTPDA